MKKRGIFSLLAASLISLTGCDILNQMVLSSSISHVRPEKQEIVYTGQYVDTTSGEEFITKVNVYVENGKIVKVEITEDSKYYTDSYYWAGADNWHSHKEEYLNKFVGLKINNIEDTILNLELDNVTGATITSNRVYKAIVDAVINKQEMEETPNYPMASSQEPIKPSTSEPINSEILEKELPEAWMNGNSFKYADCSINLIPNSDNVNYAKNYFTREDIRFFDLRDVSEGYGLGHVEGFESVSYFKVLVGNDKQLFYQDEELIFHPRYEESEILLMKIFPKDTKMFVMCQSGGRVKLFLDLLNQYGYDMSNIYNIGGWNQVNSADNYGGYNVSLGIGAINETIQYDFSSLTPIDSTFKATKRVNLPKAWEEGETYQAKECSVSLNPGSLENASAKKVSDYFTTENVRFFDLRDVSEGYGIGHIQKFESISYFNVLIGNKNQLFKKEGETFIARYAESEEILNEMFPKDATLFVMCQVGGRVQPFLTLLDQYGYDMSKVYNVGGWNQIKDVKEPAYAGYNVSVGIGASAIEYDFSTLNLIL